MSISHGLQATNDVFIEELLNDPHYDIRSNGDIYSEHSRQGHLTPGVWRKMTQRSQSGYKSIRYRKDGPQLRVHRIIYRKFAGPLDPNLVINHKDGDPTNNDISNLELVTQSENNLHAFRVLGNAPVAGNHIITPEIADEIRGQRASGMKYTQIIEWLKQTYSFATSKGHISDIVNNKIWNKEVRLTK